MNKQKFTAIEIYCMAYLSGAEKMYGVYNYIDEELSEEKGRALFIEGLNDLYEQGVVEMSMDGLYSLNPSYEELVDMICECDKCLTLVRQQRNEDAAVYVFWRKNQSVFRADVTGENFVIARSDSEDVRMRCQPDVHPNINKKISGTTVLSQLSISQAQTAVERKKPDQAVRILRSNGAEKYMAEVLTEALEKNADYYRMVLMVNQDNTTTETAANKLICSGEAFTMENTRLGSRSAIAYIPVSEAEKNREIMSMIEEFLADEGE